MKYRHCTTHLLPEVEAKYLSIVDIEMNQNRTKMIGSALYREIKRNVAMIKHRHLCVERGEERKGEERGGRGRMQQLQMITQLSVKVDLALARGGGAADHPSRSVSA